MPELPEVENVREKLKRSVLHKKITHADVFVERMVRTPDLKRFLQTIKNQTIQDIQRRGKHLIFVLNDYYLVSHLRMEGKYEFTTNEQPKNKHDHIVFYFENGEELRYNDVRKFGTMDLVVNINEIEGIATLGPEPTDKELTGSYLAEKVKNKKTSIKNVLLDQTIIAGLGNIYVDEVLFYAFIHPNRPANSLSLLECEKLCEGAKEIISLAIKQGGSSIRSYDNMGEKGSMQNFHKVYNKTNTPCIRCETTIQKTKIGGRGTHYCPNCQKL